MVLSAVSPEGPSFIPAGEKSPAGDPTGLFAWVASADDHASRPASRIW